MIFIKDVTDYVEKWFDTSNYHGRRTKRPLHIEKKSN